MQDNSDSSHPERPFRIAVGNKRPTPYRQNQIRLRDKLRDKNNHISRLYKTISNTRFNANTVIRSKNTHITRLDKRITNNRLTSENTIKELTATIAKKTAEIVSKEKLAYGIENDSIKKLLILKMEISDKEKTIYKLENEIKELKNSIPQQKLNLEMERERNKHREHMGIALEEKKEQNRHTEKIKEFEQSIKELEILTNANLEKFKTNKNTTKASNDTEIDTTTHNKCT
jgi:chromosome segregation ATPase